MIAIGLIFVASLAVIVALPIIGEQINNNKKKRRAGTLNKLLYISIVAVGLLLMSVYNGISYALYGFDSASEIAHILDTVRNGRFTFTLSAFSNALSLTAFLPSLIVVSGIDALLFYKVIYPIMLTLMLLHMYVFIKGNNIMQRNPGLAIVLALITYVYVYGFASSIRYGITFLVFLTLLVVLGRNRITARDHYLALLLATTIVLSYYTAGILSLMLLIVASFVALLCCRGKETKFFMYLTIVVLSVSVIYWFYYAQATQQHIISSLRRLLFSGSERIGTKYTIITENVYSPLPRIGLYLKTATLSLIMMLSGIGFLRAMLNRFRGGRRALISSSGLISLALTAITIGLIAGIYYTLHFYWWAVAFFFLLATTRKYGRSRLVRIVLITLVVINVLNQTMVTNVVFDMKGKEVVLAIIGYDVAPLSVTYGEYSALTELLHLSSDIRIVPDALSRPIVLQTMVLNNDTLKGVSMEIKDLFKSGLDPGEYLYISEINIITDGFWIPVGVYGTKVPLDEAIKLVKGSVVFNSGLNMLCS